MEGTIFRPYPSKFFPTWLRPPLQKNFSIKSKTGSFRNSYDRCMCGVSGPTVRGMHSKNNGMTTQ